MGTFVKNIKRPQVKITPHRLIYPKVNIWTADGRTCARVRLVSSSLPYRLQSVLGLQPDTSFKSFLLWKEFRPRSAKS